LASGRGNKLAGQVGEHLVCAELGRRGYIATPFAGNVPAFDVLATDEHCRTVQIQVKASKGDSWPSDARDWMNLEYDPGERVQQYLGQHEIEHPDLIYVCVAIAHPGGIDRFFILTKREIQEACSALYIARREKQNWRRPKNPGSFSCRYFTSDLEAFENRWELITQRLGIPETEGPLSPAADD
jgi:hypothetical protein